MPRIRKRVTRHMILNGSGRAARADLVGSRNSALGWPVLFLDSTGPEKA